ncbi:glucosylceramidase [Mucilaginibacter conchicola]|uniref:Glucosylceramidase n=1 Tax=Mucilaginibacter conchicola TaxID=2303333 RepID=A0A372P1X7_9SPHI|nr:glycoside hydrolase family 30 beta sandwich domain-containing protein [Mucilaginibacter conchicola]RFZ95757.1 glucosylceramidase [Mucilaginibacter conchicola]
MLRKILMGTLVLSAMGSAVTNAQNVARVASWVTRADKSELLKKQAVQPAFGKINSEYAVITVDDKQHYQQIDGFGFTLTGGSAQLINKLPAQSRKRLLNELFSTAGNGIGVSYLRISIGASDLNPDVFTYDDMPAGQTDPDLKNFSLAKDAGVLSLLQDIIKINPRIKILGSPWTPPSWMKTNESSMGGSLKQDCYEVYAKYLVKYIRGMKAKGITIDAVTLQNEPLNPKNNPSMVMEAAEQAAFIKNNVGPSFRSAGIKTKIITYDHNADRPDYPMDILKDPEARKYVDGSAFHLYGGKIEALSEVHNAYPDKNLYFTEQWVGAPGNFPGDLNWHVNNLIIGATRNWARNVLEWNLAADSKYEPHTPGGCTECLGAITVEKDVLRNVAYYIIGHASKFVPAGSVRIASNITGDLANVAFKTPQGKKVLIVVNNAKSKTIFNIINRGRAALCSLDAGAVGTFVW